MSGKSDGKEAEPGRICTQEEAVAEALVFASGEPVKLESIAIVLGTDKRHAAEVMDRLIAEYERRNGGILLRRVEKSYVFCSKPELREELRDYFEKPSQSGLSRAAMETLSIVAYNQPITRSGIEFVRGVNSDGVLVRLLERGLVTECGRSENPGHPILYGTTVRFLQAMGIESLAELPPLEKIETEGRPAGETPPPEHAEPDRAEPAQAAPEQAAPESPAPEDGREKSETEQTV